MTQANIEAKIIALAPAINNFTLPLRHVPYIYYLVYYKKD